VATLIELNQFTVSVLSFPHSSSSRELMSHKGMSDVLHVFFIPSCIHVFIRQEIIVFLLEGVPARIAGSGLQTSESTVCVTC